MDLLHKPIPGNCNYCFSLYEELNSANFVVQIHIYLCNKTGKQNITHYPFTIIF